jgi:hypothetical protein
MKPIPHLQSIGFGVKPPVIECQPLTAEMLTDISSRDFGRPYEDMYDQTCGNLYLWLRQSFHVLWQVDEASPKVTIYENTSDKLGEQFATLLCISREEGRAAVMEMVQALALSNYIIEHVVYKMSGNWSFKEANPILNGQLKYFLFWLAQQELANHETAQKCLGRFMKMFAADVNMSILEPYPAGLIMESFIQCFFRRQNRLDILLSKLEAATNSYPHASD